MPGASAFDPSSTYVHLADGGDADAIAVTDSFWPELISGERDYPGRLVMAIDMAEDWPQWERHPNGEELLVLLSGALTLDLEAPDGTAYEVAMEAGRAFLVPRGHWHKARVGTPGRMLFVTYGNGTDHRPAG